jgi:hypothetical protein
LPRLRHAFVTVIYASCTTLTQFGPCSRDFPFYVGVSELPHPQLMQCSQILSNLTWRQDQQLICAFQGQPHKSCVLGICSKISSTTHRLSCGVFLIRQAFMTAYKFAPPKIPGINSNNILISTWETVKFYAINIFLSIALICFMATRFTCYIWTNLFQTTDVFLELEQPATITVKIKNLSSVLWTTSF